MFERMANSFAMARSSWQVLYTDKKLLIFPILSGIACLLVTASFVAPVVLLLLQNPNRDIDFERLPQWAYYVILFAFYFCNYFVVVFFNSALTSCALIRFNGGEPTIGDGLRSSLSRLPQILAWALVSATVGVLLKAVENVHEGVGKFVSAILGTAWSIVTYFVVPILVVEKVGPIEAVQRSVAVLKHTWGEALIGNFGIGIFMFLLAIPFFVVAALGVFLLTTPATAVLGVVVLVLAVVYLLLLMAVSTAMDNIFVAALYQYAANGVIPSGFNEYNVRHAFSPKGA